MDPTTQHPYTLPTSFTKMLSLLTSILQFTGDYLFDINFDNMEIDMPPWLCSPIRSNTLTSAAKDNLAIVRHDGDDICAICLENLNHHNCVVREMPCQHMFHQKCLFSWLDIVSACPLCRYELERSLE
ncbi:hypothetical protein K7432_005560 [Basidiobolus ranarum]|uniref:RING-type domain-containing protein n=1 Tax=Basidiobolus ranarum TaxID=34480 RepID=A0ABR2W2Y0_9FUNG